uniref:Seroin transcript 1A n=1 Tax=Acanthobrahmaea europaea TaxID=119239 RepID=A0A3G1T158_9NEOP|nr:seroin transcript 1A [Acanthobrahmaea europaea]
MAFKIIFISITLAVVVNGIKWPGFDDKFGLNFPQIIPNFPSPPPPVLMPKVTFPSISVEKKGKTPGEIFSAVLITAYADNKDGEGHKGGGSWLVNDDGHIESGFFGNNLQPNPDLGQSEETETEII